MDPAMALMVAGTGFQAVQQYRADKQEAALRKQNAAILAAEGERAKESYGEEARERRKEGKRLKARQITLYAKSGMAPGTGTPLLVRNESMRQIEKQAQIIEKHGEYAYSKAMSAAELERRKGRAASKRGLWAAGSSLATGLGTALLLKRRY